MHFQVPERVGVNGAGEGHWAPSSSAASHPAYHQASLWNSLLPSTGGHIKKSDRRTEPEKKRERKRKRVRVGGQEGLRAGGTVDTLQALLSKSGQPKEDGEGRKTDWRRKGRKRRKEEGRERKTREKEAQTGIQADSGTWNTSCYSLECALSGRLIAGAGLSVCLSAASCEAYRLGWGMWLQARSSQPEIWLSASRMCLLERLWEGPGAH